MKILCAPDLHCYWPNYSRTLEDGTSSRLADWRRTADALVDVAMAHRVAAALFPGDFFPNSRPAPAQVLEVVELFSRLEQLGISVVGCAGNHDLLGPGQPSPVDVVARFSPDGMRWGITKPSWVKLDGLNVVVLPSVKVPQTNGDPAAAAQELSEELIKVARALVAQAMDWKPQPTVLMGHWAISGCSLAAGNVLAATEPTLPLGELQSLSVQAVVMGHIHTPQVIATDPLVLHTGVFERHDFGEEHNECGCYILDINTRTAKWVELPARRFWTLDLDEEDIDWLANKGGRVEDVILDDDRRRELVRDAIIRVRYRATEEVASEIDHAALIRVLEGAGAHLVAGVYPEIVRGERAREASVTETTGPREALEKWLALRDDLSAELKARVITAAEGLIKEVA